MNASTPDKHARLAPRPTWQTPVVVDLDSQARAQGNGDCVAGSGNVGSCMAGSIAGFQCANGADGGA